MNVKPSGILTPSYVNSAPASKANVVDGSTFSTGVVPVSTFKMKGIQVYAAAYVSFSTMLTHIV